MPFLLQWIIARTISHKRHFLCLDFEGLLAALGCDQGSFDRNRASRAIFAYLIKIRQIILENDLDILEIRAIIELYESEGLAVSDAFHPSIECDVFVQE